MTLKVALEIEAQTDGATAAIAKVERAAAQSSRTIAEHARRAADESAAADEQALRKRIQLHQRAAQEIVAAEALGMRKTAQERAKAENDATRAIERALAAQRVRIRQAALQVQDLFDPISLASYFVQTLAVQGAKVAGAFGLVGAAIATTLVPLATLAGTLVSTTARAATLETTVSALADALRRTPVPVLDAAKSYDELARSIEHLLPLQRELMGLQLRFRVEDLTKALDDAARAVNERAQRLQELVTTAVENLQIRLQTFVMPKGERQVVIESFETVRARLEERLALFRRLQTQLQALAAEGGPAENSIAQLAIELAELLRGTEELPESLRADARELANLAQKAIEAQGELKRVQAAIDALTGRPGEQLFERGQRERGTAPPPPSPELTSQREAARELARIEREIAELRARAVLGPGADRYAVELEAARQLARIRTDAAELEHATTDEIRRRIEQRLREASVLERQRVAAEEAWQEERRRAQEVQREAERRFLEWEREHDRRQAAITDQLVDAIRERQALEREIAVLTGRMSATEAAIAEAERRMIEAGAKPSDWRVQRLREEIALSARLVEEKARLEEADRERQRTALEAAATITSGLEQVIATTRSLREAIAALAQDLARLATRLLILRPLEQALGVYVGNWLAPSVAAPRGPIPGPHGLAAQVARGGVFQAGELLPFARGGVIDRPILFPLARGIGLAGEAGPEAILPLRRHPSGRLGVEATVGREPPRIEINVIDRRQGAPEPVQVSGPRVAAGVAAIDVVIADRVRAAIEGGALDTVLARRFGLRRA